MPRKKKIECAVHFFNLEQVANLFDAVKDSLPKMHMFRANLGSVQLFSRDVLFCPVHPSRTDCTLQLDHALDSRCSCFPWSPSIATETAVAAMVQVVDRKSLSWPLVATNKLRLDFVSSSPICIYLLDGWTRALFPVNGWRMQEPHSDCSVIIWPLLGSYTNTKYDGRISQMGVCRQLVCSQEYKRCRKGSDGGLTTINSLSRLSKRKVQFLSADSKVSISAWVTGDIYGDIFAKKQTRTRPNRRVGSMSRRVDNYMLLPFFEANKCGNRLLL